MEKSLKDFTDFELKAEIAQREAEHKKKLEEKRQAKRNRISENQAALLQVAIDHSRTNCNDKHPINPERGCVRCALINWGDFPGYTLDIVLVRED
jgi:hypothetical protein